MRKATSENGFEQPFKTKQEAEDAAVHPVRVKTYEATGKTEAKKKLLAISNSCISNF